MPSPQKKREIIFRVLVDEGSGTGSVEQATPDGFVEVKQKEFTPSQLMRLSLLRRHKDLTITEPFENWYKDQIAIMIAAIDKR